MPSGVPIASRLRRLRRFRGLTVAYELQKNLIAMATRRRRAILPRAPEDVAAASPPARVEYSRNAFESFLQDGWLDRSGLAGARVLELGPGDDLGVALRFLAAGAESVTCVDRFRFEPDPEWERSVYRLLLDELDGESRRRLSGVVGDDGRLTTEPGRLELTTATGIEGAPRVLGSARFDLIVSVAVLEHVADVPAAIDAMDELLAPGGRMVHFVDLRDHGMFTSAGGHFLEFLTLGDRVYRLMSSHVGAPNRERIGTFRRRLADRGHEAQILITNLAHDRAAPYVERVELDRDTAESVEAIRPRLAPRFASLPAEELVATGIRIRSRKPAQRRAATST